VFGKKDWIVFRLEIVADPAEIKEANIISSRDFTPVLHKPRAVYEKAS
jgi:hypothetical protein